MSAGCRLSAVALGTLLLLPEACSSAAGAAASILAGAGSDEHIWFVVPQSDAARPWVLRHHAATAGEVTFTGGLPLAEEPQGLAASGDRLWLLNAPQQVGGSWRRPVFTVSVLHNPAFGTWYFDPPDRLGIEAPLEAPGRLKGFLGTASGPVALLWPDRDGAAAGRAEARLVRLEGGTWVDIALPQDLGTGAGGDCRLAAAGAGGTDLVVLAARSGGGVAAWWLRPGTTWQRFDPEPQAGGRPLSLIEIVSTTRMDAAAALVLRDIAGAAADPGRAGGSGDIEVAYLRPGRLLPLARVPIESGSWAIMGVRDGFRLIEAAGDGSLTVRRLDATTGEAAPRQPMSGQQLSAGPIIHLLLVSAMAVGVLLVLFLVRGAPRPGSVALPPGVEPLPLLLRLAAAAIDVAIGTAAAVALPGIEPADLARLPMWTPDPADTVPVLVACGLTLAHTAALELAVHRSLGKLLVGARIAAARDGGPPGAAALAVRQAGKAMLLLVPLLVVVMAMNPGRQGLDDLMGRTIVVRNRAAAARPQLPKDR